MAPRLVDTEAACVFLVRMRNQEKNERTMLAARTHIYYLARKGKLTRHGGRGNGSALWDLYELGKQFRKKDQ